jgi:hypothetical protein
MSYTIANIKDDLTNTLHGTSLNKLQNVFGTINRGARDLLQDVDLAETKREQQITNAIYSDVYDYQLPSDLKSNKVIDIFPQTKRGLSDSARQSMAQYFEKNKDEDSFYIKYNSSTKSLRYKKTVTTGKTLADMNEITNWSVGADATSLSKDKLQYISSGASLKFDLDGSTTEGYLENASLSSLDLSDYENEGSFFLWVYFPDASAVTNVILRWGNSATAFFLDTVTTKQDGTSFDNGWNLIRFDWNGASETGTVDNSAIDYARITITYDGVADTDFRIDNLVYRIGEIFKISYYSKYLFSDASGVFKENATLDTDTVNLDTDSYNLLLYKIAEIAAQELQGEDSAFDLSYYKQEYQQRRKKYKMTNPSECLRPIIKYYKM